MGASSNASVSGTHQQCWHQLVHRDVANEGTKKITQDGHLTIVRKMESSKNTTQHATECEYNQIAVNGCQLTV